MNLFQALVDPEADTSPPGPDSEWLSEQTDAERHRRRKRHLALFAVVVPMAALAMGMLAGGLAAVFF